MASDKSNSGSEDTYHTSGTQVTSPVLRWGLMIFGVCMVGLGIVGLIVPGLPTTVFLIMAVWAFSRSSKRFHSWLIHHPRLGPPLQNWYRYRIIPKRAKILAILMMALGLAYMGYVADGELAPVLVLAAVLLPVAFYICTRASEPPEKIDMARR